MKQKLHAFDLFVLLAAFLYGNLFVLSFSKLHWGFFLIACLVLFIELTNRILYSPFLENKGKQLHTRFLGSFKKLNEVVSRPFNFRDPKSTSQNKAFGIFPKISFWTQQRGFSFVLVNQRTKTNEKESVKRTFLPCLILNTLKRGFLLGFFIESFKVGS